MPLRGIRPESGNLQWHVGLSGHDVHSLHPLIKETRLMRIVGYHGINYASLRNLPFYVD